MSEFEHRTSPNSVAAGSALHWVQKRLSLVHCIQHSAYRGPHEATDLAAIPPCVQSSGSHALLISHILQVPHMHATVSLSGDRTLQYSE